MVGGAVAALRRSLVCRPVCAASDEVTLTGLASLLNPGQNDLDHPRSTPPPNPNPGQIAQVDWVKESSASLTFNRKTGTVAGQLKLVFFLEGTRGLYDTHTSKEDRFVEVNLTGSFDPDVLERASGRQISSGSCSSCGRGARPGGRLHQRKLTQRGTTPTSGPDQREREEGARDYSNSSLVSITVVPFTSPETIASAESSQSP